MFLRKTAPAAIILCLAASIGALAQQTQTSTTNPDPLQRMGPRRMKGHRDRTGLGLQQLNLTDDQRQRTRAIFDRYLDSTRAQREELLKLREKRIANLITSEDAARAKELHQQLRDSRQSIQTEIEGVLTPEQRTQLETQRKARQDETFKRGRRFRDRDQIQ